MDIFIKSFNRAFYLDRCISSIYRFLDGGFSIIILDDGTPEKYLNKIRKKYPDVTILLSPNYLDKTKAISENIASGKPIDGFLIPAKFWYQNVQNASEYIIVTEDDVWFTRPLNIEDLQKNAKKFSINLLKLGWLGNDYEKKDLIISKISDDIESAPPKELVLMNRYLMTAFFYNRYKFFSILYKLGKVDNYTARRYWSLNSILMGFYKKKYWLEIWKDTNDKVDEKKQLINASVYYKKRRKNKNFVSRLQTEAMKTTFQSSATNSYHEYGFDFDVNLFNHIINEAWFEDKFDVMENFPQDFSISYFNQFISDKIDISEFEKWIDKFKDQYRKLGCTID